MIVYVSEDFLGRKYELGHFPHCLQGRSASHGSVFMTRGVLTVSKSIDVNLKRRRKKGGTLIEFRRWVEAMVQILLQSAIVMILYWPLPCPGRFFSRESRVKRDI